jgi:hypothetical protein
VFHFFVSGGRHARRKSARPDSQSHGKALIGCGIFCQARAASLHKNLLACTAKHEK